MTKTNTIVITAEATTEEETMRLIDADDLLTAFPIDDEPMLTKSCVRMTIRHMPTIEPQRWIPVSERLPNDGDRVIVQMLNGHICIIEFSAWGVTNHLAAWMPLPELYRRQPTIEERKKGAEDD